MERLNNRRVIRRHIERRDGCDEQSGTVSAAGWPTRARRREGRLAEKPTGERLYEDGQEQA